MAVRSPELFRITEQDDLVSARENVNRRQDAVNSTLGELLSAAFIANGIEIVVNVGNTPDNVILTHQLGYKPLGFLVLNVQQAVPAITSMPVRYIFEDPPLVVDNERQTTMRFFTDGVYTIRFF